VRENIEWNRKNCMAELQALGALAEQYLESPRVCFLCREAPATSALLFVGDAKDDGGRRQCAIFGVCMVCWCADDFQARVSAALRQDQHHGEAAVWN
jgi:hypothetical protein